MTTCPRLSSWCIRRHIRAFRYRFCISTSHSCFEIEICFRYANTNPASLSLSCYFSLSHILSLDHPRSARSRGCSCTRARALVCRLSCALLRTHALLQIHMTNWCVWHDLIACVTWRLDRVCVASEVWWDYLAIDRYIFRLENMNIYTQIQTRTHARKWAHKHTQT